MSPRPPARSRALVVLGLVTAWLVAAAGPATADPAGPTHYDSVVTAVETPGGGPADLEAEVLGGDAYLLLRVPAGTEVEVPGYDDEPYVRVVPDGTVEVNQRAPTHWYNEDRYGADVPELADVEATPVWREVATGGEYAWHEHRIHWMSPGVPDQVDTARDEAQEVFDWEIPVLVDGEEVLVRGQLAWHPGPPVWVAPLLVGLALAAAVALVLAAGVPVAALSALGAVVAGVAGALTVTGQPPGADGDLFLVLLPVLALAVAALALGARRRGLATARAELLGAASGLPLLVWGVLTAGSLTRPIAPEPFTGATLRPLTAVALGVGGAAVAALVRTGLGALPDPLADDEQPAGEQPAASDG